MGAGAKTGPTGPRPRLIAAALGICLAVWTACPVMAQQADAGPPAARTEPKLVFGMTPVVGVEPTRTRFTPLARHLAEQLDRPVELEVTATYGELVDQVAAGKVDLVKLSPLAYVQAKAKVPDLRLLAIQVANGSVDYSSYLVALQGDAHDSQKKLPGARVCFADKDSTSGYLFPLAWLFRHGIRPERDFSSVIFGGSHRACLEGLFAGRWDVAATWAGAIRDARQAGLDVGEITIVAKTGRIPYDAWCVSPDIAPALAERVKQVLLDTNTLTPKGRRVLSSTLGINGWVPVEDRTYDGIREVQAAIQAPARQ